MPNGTSITSATPCSTDLVGTRDHTYTAATHETADNEIIALPIHRTGK
jgi:hypothetical protein